MTLLKNYIQNFLNRAGSYVFVATVLSRLLSFLASWIALQFIDNEKLGVVLYSWNIIAFIMPFVGAGLPQSLIRYGALLSDESDKKSVLHYVVKNGTFASIFLSFVVAVIGLLYPFKFDNAGLYIAVFALSFIPFFLLETIKIQLRLEHNNKKFAVVDIVYNILLVLLVFGLSYFYQENGYIASLLLTPTLTSVLFFNRIKTSTSENKKLEIINKEFWKYGIFGGLSNVATMLLFAIDILLIGNLMQDSEMVTAFRYISIIPLSMLFLPRVFINTDFVTFTEKIFDKAYITNYIKSYVSLFIIISLLFVGFCSFFTNNILATFDTEFTKYSTSFIILTIGVCGILILRGLFGNLLSSIGLVKINYYITLIALIMNYASNTYLIPKLGLKGASITSASLMWFTGIASCVAFYVYYQKLLLKKSNKLG